MQYSKLAVVAVALVAAAGVFADDFANNCNAQKRMCQNNGVCHDNVPQLGADAGSRNAWKDPFCVCQAPYGGNDCSRTIRECKDNPCQNGGTCNPADCTVNTNTQNQYYDCFTCTCPFGWGGSPSYASSNNPGGLCDWKQMGNDCRNGNLCANGGTCGTSSSIPAPYTYGYSCHCPPGWRGGETAQVHTVNVAYNCTAPDCTVSAGACQNGGTCIGGNGLDRGTCSCGFYGGLQCELPRFCDNANACPDGYTCTNTGPGTGSCQAPSFCSMHTCANNGTCSTSNGVGPMKPAAGQQYCACQGNFDGGNSCNSTLFCASNPCQNGGTCSNSFSYIGNAGSCSCPPNFGGQFCEKPMVGCRAGKMKPGDAERCAPGSSCSSPSVTNPWISRCSCNGLTPVPGDLIRYDCGCNSTTLSRCPGQAGSLYGEDADMVCQNGGVCTETADGTGCACRPGFWGDKCQNYDNPCLNNLCENGGQCYIVAETTSQTDAYGAGYHLALDDRFWAGRCRCKWPFYGENCEKQAPVPGADGAAPVVCGDANSPCLNGGTCGRRTYNPNSGGYFYTSVFSGQSIAAEPWVCTCPSPTAVSYGYIGMQCETQIERCSATTCQNGGICTNVGSSVTCACPCGYAGDRCQFPATNINAASVAQFASDGAGGIGYHLEFCSREPCQNGGTCYHTTDGVNFGCNCKSGWGGNYCQYSVRSAAAGVVPSLVAVTAALAMAFALKH